MTHGPVQPKRPFAAIVGGSKVSSKIGVIESLMGKCDKIIIGGGMVFTFLKARSLSTGSSLVEVVAPVTARIRPPPRANQPLQPL